MAEFTTSDGVRLFYEDTGTGLPILALAGLTRTARDFDYVAPHLSNHRLIRTDYRGRGRSQWSDFATYSIPIEARDALELLDHLGIAKAAILGTSRGGLIAMVLAATAKDRLLGVALNDVGPVIEQSGLDTIEAYLGRPPRAKTHADAAKERPNLLPGFKNVPAERWMQEVQIHYRETPDGLGITYDPALRDAFLAASDAPIPDLWPVFDLLEGLPLLTLRGANSNLLSPETFAEMQRRRPDMIATTVEDRGHVPFLDEPESLTALSEWIELLQ